MIQLNRFTQWLKSLAAPSLTPATESASHLDFDPVWHGDHWQNLLSSPMDARHYVMEDWTTPLDGDLVEDEATPGR
ncbi:hypothetical protein AWB76_00185 [Caballeronia temeraria]|uniref:Uncharacterized protein n=1 Tax=Caballeronia temeraria TaxID=1777137 RepID=A0A157Z4Q3_9BURK|nr:hypothetical protein [Caballeronia temeraria]SAK40556.1 hypothetical protein AWB76_00185 [Caballeronia temeraria]